MIVICELGVIMFIFHRICIRMAVNRLVLPQPAGIAKYDANSVYFVLLTIVAFTTYLQYVQFYVLYYACVLIK